LRARGLDGPLEPVQRRTATCDHERVNEGLARLTTSDIRLGEERDRDEESAAPDPPECRESRVQVPNARHEVGQDSHKMLASGARARRLDGVSGQQVSDLSRPKTVIVFRLERRRAHIEKLRGKSGAIVHTSST
jgi:hypothetical protein